jgi:uncharacterized protein (TIGR02145 family)
MKKILKLLSLAFFTASMTIFFGCKKDTENPPVTAPAIATADVSTITTTSAETGGNVISTGGADVISRGVCWSTVHNPTIADNKTTEGNGSGTFTSNIAGLTPNTTYYVRAYATNSWGTAYGTEITFKSNPVVVGLATLTTNLFYYIAPTTAEPGGYLTDDGGENLTEMGICWGTAPNPTTNDSKETYAPGAGSFSILIDSLQPATKYYVRAYATNSAGTAYGNELSFTTLPINSIIFNTDLTYGSVSDVDGNIYKTIQIGTQNWMAENLKTTKYNDGNPIPDVTNFTEWSNLTTGAYCWYRNDALSYKDTYGALYNWFTINTGLLCPSGWHIPADTEWTTLFTYLGGTWIAGSKIKEIGTTHWMDPNPGATNESGFTALPAGDLQILGDPDFSGWAGPGGQGRWWSASASINIALSDGANVNNSEIYYKQSGFSVRCLKDN